MVYLFGNFLKFFNNYTADIGIVILDFLYESIKGPIFFNQQILLDSELCQLCRDLSYDLSGSDTHLGAKGFNENNLITMDILFYKTMDVLSSLLDGRINQ